MIGVYRLNKNTHDSISLQKLTVLFRLRKFALLQVHQLHVQLQLDLLQDLLRFDALVQITLLRCILLSDLRHLQDLAL